MYSNLRLVAFASLVALASVVGVLALYPDALEELLVASTETADSPTTACKQDWLRVDPSCLSRRGMPWAAASPNSHALAVPSAAEGTPDEPLTENQSAAAPVESPQRSEVAAPQQETPAPPPVAEERRIPTQQSEVTAPQQETPAPVAEQQHIEEPRSQATAPQPETSPPPPVVGERHIPKQRHEVMAPRRETPPPVAEGRRAAKPAVEPRAAAPKKPASEDRATKQRPANEALNAVRRFQDNLRDIPVSAYAADGTRRTIVIRPTSIQDVYYYFAPR